MGLRIILLFLLVWIIGHEQAACFTLTCPDCTAT
jgi:hypothetical protein